MKNIYNTHAKCVIIHIFVCPKATQVSSNWIRMVILCTHLYVYVDDSPRRVGLP